MKFGINLFSLRNMITNERELLDTVGKISDMGYSYIQYSGGPYDADMLARVKKECGLPIVLTHVPMKRIVSETEALMAEHEKFGCKNIGLGMMSKDTVTNLDELLCTVEKLEDAAEKMKKGGFKFFYHNHHFEFVRHGDKTAFDYIKEKAPHINFTFDTFWAQYGGVSVADTVSALSGRIECVHLKDYKLVRRDDALGGFEPKFAPVGEGNIDFMSLVPKMLAAGTKYFLVEQDNAVLFENPLDEVRRSIDYLKREFSEI